MKNKKEIKKRKIVLSKEEQDPYWNEEPYLLGWYK